MLRRHFLKKIFKCFFCVMKYCYLELPYLYLTATVNKEFTGKSLLNSFCAESSEKEIRLKHHISRTEKCCES